MLSRILHHHPEVLSLSEFLGLFVMDDGYIGTVPVGDLDGQQFWNVLARIDRFTDAVAQGGIEIPELLPVLRRWGGGTDGLPQVANVLAALTDQPRQLFDRLAQEVPTWPRRRAADQFRALFDWLSRDLGRPYVVERTGLSLLHLPVLRKEFPEARYVHIHRDGPDCAVSMSRTPVFRLAVLRAIAAKRFSAARGRAERAAVRAEFAGLAAPPYDVDRIFGYDVPVSAFGEMWSTWICEGMPELAKIEQGRLLTLRYEDLLTDPDTGFAALGEFIGVEVTDEWLTGARRFVEPARMGAAGRLPAAQQAELRDACEPGMRALAEFNDEFLPAAGRIR
jgi:hypothetical protein